MSICPFCRRKKVNGNWYACGTAVDSPDYHRSLGCYGQEIFNLKAEVDHYKEAYLLAEERAYVSDMLREENAGLTHTIECLRSELAECRERLELWRDAGEELRENWKKPDSNGWVEINISPEDIEKFKSLGEIK
jgi:hypothetical protein